MNVLFICLGNICRSPLAEVVLRRLYRERGIDGEVASAGVIDAHAGEPADPRSVAIAREHGLDLGQHRARRVEERDFLDFDVLYALDDEVEQALRTLAPAWGLQKVRRLRSAPLAPSTEGAPLAIPDPYEGELDAFRHVFALLAEACPRVAGELIPGVTLEPLCEANLKETLALAAQAFPVQGFLHHTRFAFPLSLRAGSWVARVAFKLGGVVRPRYWVGRDRGGAVVAFTGVYETPGDRDEALWGGWTAVSARARGRGLGRALFTFIGSLAHREGKRVVRAYTSTADGQREAQQLYEQLGMGLTRDESIAFSADRRLYRERVLPVTAPARAG